MNPSPQRAAAPEGWGPLLLVLCGQRSRAARLCSPPQRRGRASDPRHACGRAWHDDVQHQLADGRGSAGAMQRRFPCCVLLRPGLGQQRAPVGGLPGGLHVLLGPSQLQRCVTARSVGLQMVAHACFTPRVLTPHAPPRSICNARLLDVRAHMSWILRNCAVASLR